MNYRKNNGFTLIELMISVAMLAVVLAVAAPNLKTFIDKNKLKADVQNIESIFLYAKGHAVTELTSVRVCWNSTNANVTENSIVIEPGYMVAIDLGDSNELLRQVRYVDEQQVGVDDLAGNCFQFGNDGRSNINLNIAVCNEAGDSVNSRGIQVNLQGRVIISDNESGEVKAC